jgi:hypothetical protein
MSSNATPEDTILGKRNKDSDEVILSVKRHCSKMEIAQSLLDLRTSGDEKTDPDETESDEEIKSDDVEMKQAQFLRMNQCPVCGIRPNFGFRGDSKSRLYCRKHKLDGMSNIRKDICQEPDCEIGAAFGFLSDKKLLFETFEISEKS